jgi:phospholipid transport system substrate-binding protein
MTRRIFLILSLVFPSLASSATPSTAEAEQFLHKSIDEVVTVTGRIKDRKSVVDQLRPVLMRRVSFGTMAKRSVGPGWRQLSPDQQKKAIELFTTLVIRTYSSKFTPASALRSLTRPPSLWRQAESMWQRLRFTSAAVTM